MIPVAGQRTHGTTFRALTVTSQAATPGAESAVHDCLVVVVVVANKICGSNSMKQHSKTVMV